MKKTALFFIIIGMAISTTLSGIFKLSNPIEVSGEAELIFGLFYFFAAFFLNYLYGEMTIKEIKKESDILKPLVISEKLILSKSDGKAIISQSEDIFKSWIDPDFKNWGLNKESKATPETELEVYEMVKNTTFKDIFTFLSDNLDLLCLTQNQIIDFCVKRPEYLRQGDYATFFLTKKDFEKPATQDNLFVVFVLVHSSGLDVRVDHFVSARVWRADDRHRVVVPKLS